MWIRFYCGKCGKKYKVSEDMAGKVGQCAQCGARLPAPRKPTDQPMFRLFCDTCHKKVQMSVSQAGTKGRCPHCGAIIAVPRAGKAPPQLATDDGVHAPDSAPGSGETTTVRLQPAGKPSSPSQENAGGLAEEIEQLIQQLEQEGGKEPQFQQRRPKRTVDAPVRTERTETPAIALEEALASLEGEQPDALESCPAPAVPETPGQEPGRKSREILSLILLAALVIVVVSLLVLLVIVSSSSPPTAPPSG